MRRYVEMGRCAVARSSLRMQEVLDVMDRLKEGGIVALQRSGQ